MSPAVQSIEFSFIRHAPRLNDTIKVIEQGLGFINAKLELYIL